ncbi:MAG: porin [Nitrospira sp.]|nr:porin [Nitrospira sp.]
MANKHLKPSLLTSAVAAGLVAVPMSASAQDLNLKISGQINKTFAIIDNGDSDAWGVLDNINSGSRFRFTGSQDVGNGAKMGGVWEWQWSNSSTSGNTFNSAGEFSERSASLGDRKTELYYQAGWGKVSLGKGDGAANGTAEVDLSGTTTIDYAGGNQCIIGSITYGTGSSTVTTVTVGTTYSEFDGESRNTRVRYDTPKMGWGGIAVSLGNQGLVELAYRGSWSIGNGKLAVAAGATDTGDRTNGGPTGGTFTTTEDSENRERAMVSASYLMGMGLNFTLSYSTNEPEAGIGATGPSPLKQSLTYFKVGWKKGKHAFSLSLGEAKNRGSTTTDATSTTLAYNFKAAKFAEMYAGYRVSDSDISTLSKVTSINLGSRIKWK